jgi:hypothetical protein
MGLFVAVPQTLETSFQGSRDAFPAFITCCLNLWPLGSVRRPSETSGHAAHAM